MFCESCGARLPDDSQFCTVCGAPTGGAPVPASPPRKRRVWPAVLITVSLLVIAAAVTVTAIKLTSDGSEKTEEKTEEAATADGEEPPAEEETEPSERTGEPEKTEEPEEAREDEVHALPVFSSVSASDTLIEEGYDHSPKLAVDGYTDTAWAVSGGEGEWIMLSASGDQYVSGLKILNGYNKFNAKTGKWQYYPNSRPKRITVSFSDGSSVEAELADVFSEGEDALYQDVSFSRTVRTNYIKITVDEVYPGDTWSDTCISEIEVY